MLLLCSLVADGTSHCFSCVLCVRSKPLVPVYTQEKGSIHEDMNTRGQGSLETLDTAYHVLIFDVGPKETLYSWAVQ